MKRLARHGDDVLRRAIWIAMLCAVVSMVSSPTVMAGGFGPAAETANARVVKLYGLGAGIQVNYGTGILISADGQVLTVLSLLIDARRVRAVTADGITFEARVLQRDTRRQLALLQLFPWNDDDSSAYNWADEAGYESSPGDAEASRPVGPFPHFDIHTGQPHSGVVSDGPSGEAPAESEALADSDPSGATDLNLHPGDWVVAAGNAFKVAVGSEPVSITHGIFSTRTRLDARRRVKEFPYHGDVLIIDAITSNVGAPGGAVVNLDGVLVGMIGRVVLSNRTHTHVNHAVPRDVLSDFVRETLKKKDEVAMVDGVGVGSARHERDGLLISDQKRNTPADVGIRLNRTGYRQVLPFVDRVRRGSPAAKAGVRSDDLILSIDGRTVADVRQYDKRVSSLPPGEPFDLVIRRGRRILSIRIDPEDP